MFGYIYLTTNLINGKVYVGKHKSATYDEHYYGSGKIIQNAIKKYGIKNFSNEMLYEADTLEDLNTKEKYYIKKYRELYGNNCYNIADGGDGGDTFSGKSEEEQNAFIEKMTIINKKRCNTVEFKTKMSIAGHKRYIDENERKLQSERSKKAWSNPELIEAQRKRVKEYYKNHTKDASYMFKPCVFELNDTHKEFDSVKDLMEFLQNEFNYAPHRQTFSKLMRDGAKGIPFNPFHKNKLSKLKGMLIYYKQDRSVETMGDECNPVEVEIDTTSKRKTEIEDIVHAV